MSAAALVVLFAYFSLTFTIQALSSAPPVVSFIRLTGYTQGLDPYRDRLADQPALDRPARITRPMAVGVGIAWVAAVLAVQGALR